MSPRSGQRLNSKVGECHPETFENDGCLNCSGGYSVA